jgi:hypothetical protein
MKGSITIHKELHRIFCFCLKCFYELLLLIKIRKSRETDSNILIFSFSIVGRLKLRNNGRFNPSRNLNTSFYDEIFRCFNLLFNNH